MFAVIYCFLPLFLAIFYYTYSRKRKLVIWNINKGEMCYQCKESLELKDEILIGRLLDTTDFKTLCTSCKRENKISQLKKPYLKWKFKFQIFLYSKDFSKIYWIFPIIIFVVILIDVISMFVGNKLGLWWVYGTLNLLFYFILFIKLKYTTVKK